MNLFHSFLMGATNAAEGTTGGGNSYIYIIMLVALVAVFYFMIIRPENKKKKEAEALRSSLKKGDKITTIGGLVGTICSIKDDMIVIETSEDMVRIEMKNWAVMTNNSAEEEKKKRDLEAKEKARELAAAKAKEKADKKANKVKR